MQKICIISFDHWDYDKHIITALQKKGIDSFHIKIGGFKHKNSWSRLNNTLSKLFFNKNPKFIKRQDYIIESLKNNGFQDQILVINPELIDLEYHLAIKKYTDKYIAYLYDSVSRCPVKHLLEGIFDEIFSFDKADVLTYGFSETTNYIYFDTPEKASIQKQNFIYIGSIDNRLKFLNDFGEHIKKHQQSFLFYAIGKKAFINKLKQLFLGKNKNIIFQKKRFTQQETLKMYAESETIVDLVRENQKGLSFRVFEAMALQKKLITDNATISNYSFYNENNIFIINETNIDTMYSFFSQPYEKLPSSIYGNYTVDSWSGNIFNLKN